MRCNRADHSTELIDGDGCLPNQAPPHKEPGSLYVNDGLFLCAGCQPSESVGGSETEGSWASVPGMRPGHQISRSS